MYTDQKTNSLIRSSEKALWISFTVALDETTDLEVSIIPTEDGKTNYKVAAHLSIKKFFAFFSSVFEESDLSELQEFVEQFLDQIILSIAITPDVSKRFECAGVLKGKEVRLVVESVKSKQLFVSLNLGLFLSANEIPILGKHLPADFKIGIESVSSSEKGLIINAKLGDNLLSFPLKQPTENSPSATPQTIEKTPSTAPASDETKPAVTSKTENDASKSFDFKLKIDKFEFVNNYITVKLDASINVWLLRFDLVGLQIALKLEFPPRPIFQFDGIGLSFSKPPIEMTGMFYKNSNLEYDDYIGLAIIKTKVFSISAIGGYAPANNSFFVYGVLDYPLGGIPAFFIVGLALGFGVNRKLLTPSITNVSQFPLVQLAMNNSNKPADSITLVKSIATYIPPENGNYWMAVGIKFTSFELIKGFALLIVSFGQQLKFALLGLARISMPDKDPIVVVELALRAEIDIDAGTIQIEAQLTTASFLLDPECHITGGFAYYLWLKGVYQGDFVLSIGGYHPNFLKPSHYPVVPRVGLNWLKKMDGSSLSFKGLSYFALTPTCVMAGAEMEIDFKMGNLTANFKAGVHFLISWMPFHYEMQAHISIYVCYNFKLNFGFFKVSFNISASFGASLSVWGPSFGGKAHVNICIISFDISFGEKPSIKPASVSDFRKKYLPEESFCTTSLVGGMIKEWNEDNVRNWWVDPHQLEINIESAVPLKSCDNLQSSQPVQEFGIAPANISSDKFITTIHVSVTKDSETISVNIEPVYGNVPKALWGKFESQQKLNNGDPTINNVLTGLKIKPLLSIESQDNSSIILPEINYDLTINKNKIFFKKEFNDFDESSLKDEMELIACF